MGYANGHIYSLDLATEQLSLIADILMKAEKLVAVSNKYILVCGPATYDDEIKTVDITTGQVIDSVSPHYSFGELVLNPSINTVYTYTLGVSPGDLHYFKIDPGTGEINATGDSIYHGDYSYGPPLKIISDGSRIATSSGNLFTSSQLVEDDLHYAGTLGHKYEDLVVDKELGYLYILNRYSFYSDDYDVLKKLIILNESNYQSEKTIDLKGYPKYAFNTTTNIIVIIEYGSNYYVKLFNKQDLGL